jgi:nitrite reductase/ring-hydroxylating ferredoxin subunit
MASRVRIGRVEDFVPGTMREVEAAGTKLIVTREGEDICAARNRCPHLGLSLTSGPGGQHYADGVVQCPWHNSRFVVRTGENLDWASGIAGRSIPRWSQRLLSAGRRPAPLATYPVVVEAGEVFVEL